MALGICQGTGVVIVAPDISRWQDARDCTTQLSLRLQLICAPESHPSIHRHSHFDFCPRDRVSATHPSRLEIQIFAYRYKFNRTDSQARKNRWQFKIFHSFIHSIDHKCVRSPHNVKPVTHTRSMNISCRQPLLPLGQCLIVLFQINLLLGL